MLTASATPTPSAVKRSACIARFWRSVPIRTDMVTMSGVSSAQSAASHTAIAIHDESGVRLDGASDGPESNAWFAIVSSA